jgi:tetratricopeptide (TPR) repeat protein
MGNLRGWSARWVLPAICLGVAATAHAACNGPQTLVAAMTAHPTTGNAIQLGSWYASRKQFECAVETFHTALKADPQSAQLNYLESLAMVGAGQFSAATPPLLESIRLDSTVLKPHLLLAELYEKSGKISEADEQWRQALAIDPHSDVALDSFSASLLARKDYAGVIGVLQHAPRTETLAIRLAQALDALNYLDGASDVLLEATKLSPDSLALAKAESVVLIRKRAYLEATKLWKYTVEHHPGNREAELNYLRILVMTQHYTLARPLGIKLLAATPHDPEVLYLNGVEDHEVGDYPAAKAHLEDAVAQVPDFYYSRFYLGVALVALHEWKEGKENLEKAIALGYTDSKAHYELALALHGLGENDQAAREIQQFQDMKKAEEDTLEASSNAAQGDEDLTAGKIQEAIAHYRSACASEPGNGGYKYKLSIALHKAGDAEGERAQLEEAVKLDPKLAGAQKQLGYLLARSGDAAASIEHLQMAVQDAPAWVDAWINLSGELAEAGQFAEARNAVQMALRLDPANAQARKLSDQLARDPSAQQANP